MCTPVTCSCAGVLCVHLLSVALLLGALGLAVLGYCVYTHFLCTFAEMAPYNVQHLYNQSKDSCHDACPCMFHSFCPPFIVMGFQDFVFKSFGCSYLLQKQHQKGGAGGGGGGVGELWYFVYVSNLVLYAQSTITVTSGRFLCM